MDVYQISTIVLGMITFMATCAGAYYGYREFKLSRVDLTEYSYSRSVLQRKNYKYDLFISSPLAGFSSDAEIAEMKGKVEKIVEFLKNEMDYKVYWAGKKISKKADFIAPDMAAKNDVEAILGSKSFLLLYPSKIVSSVLFEAGIALRECQTSIYVVQNESELPFLMTQAAQVFKNVKTYNAQIPDEILGLIKNGREAFFEPLMM